MWPFKRKSTTRSSGIPEDNPLDQIDLLMASQHRKYEAQRRKESRKELRFGVFVWLGIAGVGLATWIIGIHVLIWVWGALMGAGLMEFEKKDRAAMGVMGVLASLAGLYAVKGAS